MKQNRNIVLIGMCGVGKSTVGVLLAKALRRNFVDTDVYIQALEQRSLQELLDEKGIEEFCRLEEGHILCIDIKNAVIATGGSAVYSEPAMRHLTKDSTIIHLDMDFALIEKRITNINSRGIVIAKGQSLKSLYDQRHGLYERYADFTINCDRLNQDQVVDEIIKNI